MNNVILWALIATIGTWGLTAIGSATVLFIKKPNQRFLNLMLGFSSGVMIAASFWSLLEPAIARAETTLSTPAYIVVTLGFLTGAVFIWLSDRAISYALVKSSKTNSKSSGINRIIMLVLSITLHNIPEGTAVSVPLRREGYSRTKSFMFGQGSAIVEPIAGVLGAALVSAVETILPFALSFAAGAMIIVAVHELIPECQSNKNTQPYSATMGIISGFAVMMLLDVMLG